MGECRLNYKGKMILLGFVLILLLFIAKPVSAKADVIFPEAQETTQVELEVDDITDETYSVAEEEDEDENNSTVVIIACVVGVLVVVAGAVVIIKKNFKKQ